MPYAPNGSNKNTPTNFPPPQKVHGSAVGIATGYGLDDQGFGVQFPVGQEFSLLHVVQTGYGTHPTSYPMGPSRFKNFLRVHTGSGAHSVSYPMGTRDSFYGGKAAGMWSWPLTSN
jgi:hypothetical protein